MPTVPKEYLGVWQRTLLETTAGVHDTTTPVRWLQTESLFCDVRAAPHAAAAPPPPAGPLSSCDEAQLHSLAAGGGFAGHTVVSGDLCNWIREVDFQPPGGPPDIGKMRFETPTMLIEDDPEGSYHEVWEKLPESEGACWAFRLSQGSRKAFLCVAGDCWAFVADRPHALPPVPSAEILSRNNRLLGVVEKAATLDAKRSALSFEASYGRVAASADVGGAPLPAWRVEISTLPGRVGSTLLSGPLASSVQQRLGSGEPLFAGAFCPTAGWFVADDASSDHQCSRDAGGPVARRMRLV